MCLETLLSYVSVTQKTLRNLTEVMFPTCVLEVCDSNLLGHQLSLLRFTCFTQVTPIKGQDSTLNWAMTASFRALAS